MVLCQWQFLLGCEQKTLSHGIPFLQVEHLRCARCYWSLPDTSFHHEFWILELACYLLKHSLKLLANLDFEKVCSPCMQSEELQKLCHFLGIFVSVAELLLAAWAATAQEHADVHHLLLGQENQCTLICGWNEGPRRVWDSKVGTAVVIHQGPKWLRGWCRVFQGKWWREVGGRLRNGVGAVAGLRLTGTPCRTGGVCLRADSLQWIN